MTRRRSSAPGSRPARRIAMLLGLVAIVAACGGASVASDGPSDAASLPPTAVPGSDPPPSTVVTAPPASAVPEPSDVPSSDPASPAPTPTEAPTEDPVSGATCTGNDGNVGFFVDFATKVTWPVYCPVLPDGWFVGTGQWRQADGGRLEISYRGPDGAGLVLQEGSFCSGDGDCVPDGTEIGPTAFADREGTLLDTADGWAVAVARGERPSWLLTVMGTDEATARSIAADLVVVGD